MMGEASGRVCIKIKWTTRPQKKTKKHRHVEKSLCCRTEHLHSLWRLFFLKAWRWKRSSIKQGNEKRPGDRKATALYRQVSKLCWTCGQTLEGQIWFRPLNATLLTSTFMENSPQNLKKTKNYYRFPPQNYKL